jgi:hypothetical protein
VPNSSSSQCLIGVTSTATDGPKLLAVSPLTLRKAAPPSSTTECSFSSSVACAEAFLAQKTKSSRKRSLGRWGMAQDYIDRDIAAKLRVSSAAPVHGVGHHRFRSSRLRGALATRRDGRAEHAPPLQRREAGRVMNRRGLSVRLRIRSSRLGGRRRPRSGGTGGRRRRLLRSRGCEVGQMSDSA